MINIAFIRDHFYYIIFGIFCICIIIGGIYNIITNKKGSWSSNYIYIPPKPKDIDQKPSSGRPFIKESSGEKMCRKVLEEYFQKPFPKNRPDFLCNTVTGGDYNLELDCYNRDLKLAVEYQGIQHAKYVPFFHKNKEMFYNQKYRDLLKVKLCQEHDIILIHVDHTIKNENIKQYLINELKKRGF